MEWIYTLSNALPAGVSAETTRLRPSGHYPGRIHQRGYFLVFRFRRYGSQVWLTVLIALLLGSLLFLTAAMNNSFRGGFSVDASAFESVLHEMVT